jgi:hypothetical protein
LHEFISSSWSIHTNSNFFLLPVRLFPIGQSVLKRNLIGSTKSNRKLINFLSNELINLRKGIGAIFYQHFHCIDSNWSKIMNIIHCYLHWNSRISRNIVPVWSLDFSVSGAIETVQLAIPAKPKHVIIQKVIIQFIDSLIFSFSRLYTYFYKEKFYWRELEFTFFHIRVSRHS